MSFTNGTWGFGRWGSAVWGWAQTGAVLRGTIVSENLMNCITQAQSASMQMSFEVLLDGVDVSSLVENISTRNFSLGGSNTAQIVFSGKSVSGLVIRSSEIEIRVSVISGSASYEGVIFRGIPISQVAYPGARSQSVTVNCSDDGFVLDDNAPMNTIWTGNAIDLISQELNELGFSIIDSTFQDYALSAFNCQQYKTVRELIVAVANGRYKTYAFLDIDGIFRLYDASRIGKLVWSIPLTGQTAQQQIDNARNRFNRVIASNGSGLSYTYDNADFQAVQGVLSKEITAPLCLNLSDLANFAGAYAAESQAEEWEIETPLNPFVKIGEELGFMGSDGVGRTIRVEEISRYLAWPGGCWQKVRGRAFPMTPERVLFLQDTPIVFDNTFDGWRGRSTVPDLSAAGVSLPRFTVAVDTVINFISTLHETAGATPGTVILRNVDTLAEYSFTMSASTRWTAAAFFEWYSATGTEIPAGTYEIEDSDEATWGIVTEYVYGGAAGTTVYLGSPIAQVRGAVA